MILILGRRNSLYLIFICEKTTIWKLLKVQKCWKEERRAFSPYLISLVDRFNM